MDLNHYQTRAMQTAIYPEVGEAAVAGVIYTSLGLVGEAGEIANKVKKIIRDSGGELSNERQNDLLDELGDVLWYVAMLAVELDANLADVAAHNLRKLKERASKGALGGSGDHR